MRYSLLCIAEEGLDAELSQLSRRRLFFIVTSPWFHGSSYNMGCTMLSVAFWPRCLYDARVGHPPTT